MAGPTRLVDWAWVTVEVECSLCHRAGRYRLARLAERLGCEFDLASLLHVVSAKCTIPRWDEPTRQYEARCGVRYRVPACGPALGGLPARQVGPDEPPIRRPHPKRRGPEGPLPTVGDCLRQGITRVRLHCYALDRHGAYCHHTGALDLAALALPGDLPFIHIPTARRLRCTRCGGREVSAMPDWPTVRGQMAGDGSVREVRNGIVIEVTPTDSAPIPPR